VKVKTGSLRASHLCLLLFAGILAPISAARGQGPLVETPKIDWTGVETKDREIIETVIDGAKENERRVSKLENLVLEGKEWAIQKVPPGNEKSVDGEIRKTFTVYRHKGMIRYDRKIVTQKPPSVFPEERESSSYDGVTRLFVQDKGSAHMRPLNKYSICTNFGGIFRMTAANPLRGKESFESAFNDHLETYRRLQSEKALQSGGLSVTITKRENADLIRIVFHYAIKYPAEWEIYWEILPDKGCQIGTYFRKDTVLGGDKHERIYTHSVDYAPVQGPDGSSAWIPIKARAVDTTVEVSGERRSDYGFDVEKIDVGPARVPADTFSFKGMGAVGIPIYDHFSDPPREFLGGTIDKPMFEKVMADAEQKLKDSESHPTTAEGEIASATTKNPTPARNTAPSAPSESPVTAADSPNKKSNARTYFLVCVGAVLLFGIVVVVGRRGRKGGTR